MPIPSGTKIGSYEIAAQIGAGGMGEVYRATDTRLGRSVAMKILPDVFARDADRTARFEREAKILASLNHPNIAALYGLETSEGRHFLIMELVEGDTLAERLRRGPTGPDEALKIAHQSADALEAAHEKGVIHRDLKPANVKIPPEGKVKVLDFGLAKALDTGTAAQDIQNSPTLSFAATQAGVILGTAAYMSPEQAKGFPADGRSDIFSFGSVFYEMLTGRQPFQGQTASEVLASVLVRDADLTALPPNLNPRLRDLIRRCLDKEPKRRWQAIGDVRFEIDAIESDPRGIVVALRDAGAKAPLWRRAMPFAAVAAVVAILTGLAVWNLRPQPPPTDVMRFSFSIPEAAEFTRTGRPLIALSPDGHQLVFVANNQLYLRSMSETEAKPIPGTNEDVNSPFFSPDGQWIGFYSFANLSLKKMPGIRPAARRNAGGGASPTSRGSGEFRSDP